MEPQGGVEPPTYALQVRCSSIELQRHKKSPRLLTVGVPKGKDTNATHKQNQTQTEPNLVYVAYFTTSNYASQVMDMH